MQIKYPRSLAAGLALSAAGATFIATNEGTHQRSYLDSGGLPTICTGHTGPEVKLGLYYSKEQCAELLRQDSQSAVNAVRKSIKVPLYQTEFDALVDFCFNVGNQACTTSTLFTMVNRKQYEDAAEQFRRWRFVKGEDCAYRKSNCYGVYQRRLDEAKLFRSEH